LSGFNLTFIWYFIFFLLCTHFFDVLMEAGAHAVEMMAMICVLKYEMRSKFENAFVSADGFYFLCVCFFEAVV